MTERQRNFWGWGWLDKFPDASARRSMGQMVAAMLGFSVGDPVEPHLLEQIELAAPRCQPPAALTGFCSVDPVERIQHSYGKNYRDVVRGFYGQYGNAPDIVAFPTVEAQISALLDWAGDNRVAVIPFGGGTSVVGGVEPDVGGDFSAVVTLDMRRMNRILQIDPTSLSARIEAGATTPQINSGLAEHGLVLRHYPQSYEFATLGGYIATRSGGHFATVYTHIDELVASTRMISPSGLWESRRLPGSGAGPSPDRLVIGSEGAFGVITDAWVRVQQKPVYRAAASVLFSDYWQAVEATRTIAQSGLFPANCRLLDSREAALNMVTNDGSNVLILGFESADHPLQPWMERALAIATHFGGRCTEGARYRESGERASAEAGAASSWRNAFLEAPYLMNAMVSLGVIADTFETACTWDRFPEFHRGVIRAVRQAMKEVCGSGRISCRFTHVYPDGPAPYYTFLAPARRGDELAQWTEIKHAASEALVALGGTITHHHAVGRVHRPQYEKQRPSLFGKALEAVRRTFDPAGIMNPGCLLPPSN